MAARRSVVDELLDLCTGFRDLPWDVCLAVAVLAAIGCLICCLRWVSRTRASRSGELLL